MNLSWSLCAVLAGVVALPTSGPAPAWAGPAPGPPATPPATKDDRLAEPPRLTAAGKIVTPPDLSGLPEVEDRTTEPPPAPPAPPPPPQATVAPPQMPMPYLGQMLADPEIDFVPSNPTRAINPRAIWDGLFVPPPPTPRELLARRLRNGGIGLLAAGAILAVVAIGTLADGAGSSTLQGVGYASLIVSLGAFGAGGTLFGLGDYRLKLARRAAAGLSP